MCHSAQPGWHGMHTLTVAQHTLINLSPNAYARIFPFERRLMLSPENGLVAEGVPTP